ncbi:MAG TPA: hypothetical protein VGO40_07540, partial [Longimicrobium sp.]|nr:hypothetical protein [Longimicrobium sp.]
MPKHLYLPALVEGLPEPQLTGHWAPQERKVLLGIADGIVVDESARIRGVSSVPDPWARALMFRAAIRVGSRYPLRARLVQEWRGLLSLLALYKLHSYRVEIVPVPLDGAGRFARSLHGLKPPGIELEPGKVYDWGDVLMVRVEGVPVGALSPATLVYTAADYAPALLKKHFALADEGYLRPPDTPDEKRYLAAWLHSLRARLNTRFYKSAGNDDSNPAIAVTGDLNRLISDWLAELGVSGQEVPRASEVVVAEEPTKPIEDTDLLERYGVYRELLRPIEVLPSEYHSDLALRVRRNRTPWKEVVVITPHLLGKDTKIWDSKRLTHLGGDVRTAMERHFADDWGTVIDREDISRHQAVWIRPERFFLTDTVLAARDGGSFLSATEGEMNAGGRFVFPFRREILDFFSPEDIQRELRPAFRESDTEVVFTFSLPVGPGSSMERVERAYRKAGTSNADSAVHLADPPVLDLFPNYLGPDWRRYYLFQAGAGEVEAVPVVGDPACVVASRDYVDTVPPRPRVRITQLSGDTLLGEGGERVTSPFPDGIELRLRGERERPAGLVLLGTGAERGELSRSWRIGVDFGTSNTNVFRKDSEAENAEGWKFDFPSQLRPITEVPYAVRSPLLERFFVPNSVVALPVPSLLRVYASSRRDAMFLDYTIPFGGEHRIPENVYGNLKWDDEDRKTEYFLECLFFFLLIQVAERRIRTLDLACSYPKAFSMNASSIFRGDVERVKGLLVDGPDRVVGGAVPGDRRKLEVIGPVFEVEGIAAGEFFASEMTISDPTQVAMKQIAAVCLDVGGGTTDVSIWSRNDIIADASMQLAGRQISRLLQRNLRLLERLFPDDEAASLDERQNEPELFAARLNLVLRKQESHVRDMLLRHATHPDVLWLRRMLALEFCSIA